MNEEGGLSVYHKSVSYELHTIERFQMMIAAVITTTNKNQG